MQTLRQFQEEFNAYCRKNTFSREPEALYEPVDYILSLGGKRIRPVVLLMAHALFDTAIEKALPAAYAIEIFHNFTLLHDDIMDEAPLRRGKPTVHKKYDVNTGILSGDAMMIYAYEYLMKSTGKAELVQLMRIFNRFSIGVCEGQRMDMNFETQPSVSIDEYLKMIELKTAVLLGGALEIGALIGGASEEDATRLEAFGRNLGIAFQLQDDMLDTFGDPEKFGKKVGGDFAQNKKTFLFLKALEVAEVTDHHELLAWYGGGPKDEAEKIEAVKRLFRKLDIPALAEAEKQSFQQKAFENLEAVAVSEEKKAALRGLADLLISRDV